MAEQLTGQLSSSAKLFSEKSGSRIHLDSYSVSGDAAPTEVQIRNGTKNTAIVTETLVYVDTNPPTITRAAGSFITDGFKVGDLITITGASEAGNNQADVLITVLTALIMTLSALDDVTADASDTNDTTFVATNSGIIHEVNDVLGHFDFASPLQANVHDGSGLGDLYVTILGGTTPKVSGVGSRGTRRR